MVTVVVFEFGVMRCQPLRRALVAMSNRLHCNMCCIICFLKCTG
ncbi:acetyltransferase [Vibrio cholerae]|nr:acetyltransferase [Vibrio cholerae]